MYSLQLPVGWVATPSLGKAQNNSSVIFTNASMAGTILQIGVMRSSTASKDFARRGRPTLYIGGYPAFQADTHAGKQVPVPAWYALC